jgi:hypothetical protein
VATEVVVQTPEDVRRRSTGILWGPAKAGKTTLLASLPGRKLLVNIDPDGHEPIAYREDFSLLDISSYDHGEIVRIGEKKVPTLIKETENIDSVIIDSLSSYGWAALNHAINTGVGKGGGFTPSIEAPGLSAYGARTNYIIAMVRNALKATAARGQHCWFTAHMDTPEKDKAGNFLYQSMNLSDNGVNQTSLSISEIWFMERDSKKTTIAVQPCRGRKPMGSRIFDQRGDVEFELKYDINEPDTQPHSMSTFWRMYLHGGRKKLPLPGTNEFMKLYKELPEE